MQRGLALLELLVSLALFGSLAFVTALATAREVRRINETDEILTATDVLRYARLTALNISRPVQVRMTDEAEVSDGPHTFLEMPIPDVIAEPQQVVFNPDGTSNTEHIMLRSGSSTSIFPSGIRQF